MFSLSFFFVFNFEQLKNPRGGWNRAIMAIAKKSFLCLNRDRDLHTFRLHFSSFCVRCQQKKEKMNKCIAAWSLKQL